MLSNIYWPELMVVSIKHKFQFGIKAITELPAEQTFQYLRYKFALKSGYLKRATRNIPNQLWEDMPKIRPLIDLPDRAVFISRFGDAYKQQLVDQANEVVGGKLRLFGSQPVDLILDPPSPLLHWTDHENKSGIEAIDEIGDIKFVWEPARFGWACILARAYYLTRNERYLETFWT